MDSQLINKITSTLFSGDKIEITNIEQVQETMSKECSYFVSVLSKNFTTDLNTISDKISLFTGKNLIFFRK